MPKTATVPAKTQPAHEIRVGQIKAAIWRNESEDGLVRHNVTFERLYKDGDKWKSSASFGRDDLLALAKVADLAHSWIISLPENPPRSSERSTRSDLTQTSLPKTPQ